MIVPKLDDAKLNEIRIEAQKIQPITYLYQFLHKYVPPMYILNLIFKSDTLLKSITDGELARYAYERDVYNKFAEVFSSGGSITSSYKTLSGVVVEIKSANILQFGVVKEKWEMFEKEFSKYTLTAKLKKIYGFQIDRIGEGQKEQDNPSIQLKRKIIRKLDQLSGVNREGSSDYTAMPEHLSLEKPEIDKLRKQHFPDAGKTIDE